MRGSKGSSCCRSASITATTGASADSMPSRAAPDSPRLPMRLISRQRGSARATARTASPVPSGEASSTNTISNAVPDNRGGKARHQRLDIAALVIHGHDDA